jgi:hypothetical protein
MNNLSSSTLVKKVLSYVSEHKEVTLDETVIRSKCGFNQLAKEGYLRIDKKGDEYIATITDKGLKTLHS